MVFDVEKNESTQHNGYEARGFIMSKWQGFSLIELLVVIAIIGVLAAVAVPTYKNYIIKTNLTKIINRLSESKAWVETTYATTGAFPAMQYIDDNNDYWSQWDGNQLFARMGNQPNSILHVIGGRQVALVANVDADTGVISWECMCDPVLTIPCSYLPASCQTNCTN